VKLYFDTSALVKLVQHEAQSAALHRFVHRHRSDTRVTSAIARTELIRALAANGPDAINEARRLLGNIEQVAVGIELLDAAANLPAIPMLRSLDAIHLASARTVVTGLRAVVTYDTRMAAAAEALGLPTAAPA